MSVIIFMMYNFISYFKSHLVMLDNEFDGILGFIFLQI
jgi:hypothetical protein